MLCPRCDPRPAYLRQRSLPAEQAPLPQHPAHEKPPAARAPEPAMLRPLTLARTLCSHASARKPLPANPCPLPPPGFPQRSDRTLLPRLSTRAPSTPTFRPHTPDATLDARAGARTPWHAPRCSLPTNTAMPIRSPRPAAHPPALSSRNPLPASFGAHSPVQIAPPPARPGLPAPRWRQRSRVPLPAPLCPSARTVLPDPKARGALPALRGHLMAPPCRSGRSLEPEARDPPRSARLCPHAAVTSITASTVGGHPQGWRRLGTRQVWCRSGRHPAAVGRAETRPARPRLCWRIQGQVRQTR